MLQQPTETIKIHYKNTEKLAVTVGKTKAFLSRHGYHGGYVKKLNCRIWSSENPRVIVEKSGGVIGPYFFENDVGSTVTANRLRYRQMIKDFLWSDLDGIDLDNVYFEQDNETISHLRETFPDRVLSGRGEHNWPPRSCDLTPCDFFL